jgi:hypothetical protein
VCFLCQVLVLNGSGIIGKVLVLHVLSFFVFCNTYYKISSNIEVCQYNKTGNVHVT